MNYKISIEGQIIDLPEEIAGEDSKLKSILSPLFPGAANAKFIRSEPKDDVITVTVVKQAGTKGLLASPAKLGPAEPPNDPRIFNRRQADGTFRPLAKFFDGQSPTGKTNETVEPQDQVLRKLIEAHEGINPVVELNERISAVPLNQKSFAERVKVDQEIEKVLKVGEMEMDNMIKAHGLLVSIEPQPAPVLVRGF